MKAKDKTPCLDNRSWQQIKHFIRNKNFNLNTSMNDIILKNKNCMQSCKYRSFNLTEILNIVG